MSFCRRLWRLSKPGRVAAGNGVEATPFDVSCNIQFVDDTIVGVIVIATATSIIVAFLLTEMEPETHFQKETFDPTKDALKCALLLFKSGVALKMPLEIVSNFEG